MKLFISTSLLLGLVSPEGPLVSAFVPANRNGIQQSKTRIQQSTTTGQSEELIAAKKELMNLLGNKEYEDPVLADPITKEPISIATPGVLFGGESKRRNVQYQIKSASNKFEGSTDTYINLLEPVSDDKAEESSSSPLAGILKQTIPYIPLPLRQPIAQLTDGEFIPMRDLFTSPAVSYAYERGWRQGFAAAGFPGPDEESRMAMDYFAPVVAKAGAENAVVVDMSCATGLFTRRFAAEDKYGRVLGCDYSESMLTEARRRIDGERKLNSLKTTHLDLVQLDVGNIPMQDGTVDCLHAGAAMHCWPDLDAAASEIYRVLKPGGRYFATTFLSQYFSTLSTMDGAANTPASQTAFQYFESVDTLRSLLERGGFEHGKIMIEILGNACVVIRAEK